MFFVYVGGFILSLPGSLDVIRNVIHPDADVRYLPPPVGRKPRALSREAQLCLMSGVPQCPGVRDGARRCGSRTAGSRVPRWSAEVCPATPHCRAPGHWPPCTCRNLHTQHTLEMYLSRQAFVEGRHYLSGMESFSKNGHLFLRMDTFQPDHQNPEEKIIL